MQQASQSWHAAPHQAILGLDRHGEGVIEFGTSVENMVTELDGEGFSGSAGRNARIGLGRS